MVRNKQLKLMGEINVVPYIDVMLVLLIIFMVTAPLLTQGIEVELPDAAAEPLADDLLRDHQPLILSVNASGDLFMNIGKNEDQAIDGQGYWEDDGDSGTVSMTIAEDSLYFYERPDSQYDTTSMSSESSFPNGVSIAAWTNPG